MLFHATPEKEFGTVIKLVTQTLTELGYNPATARIETEGDAEARWRIQKGSAVVFISVSRQETQNVLRLVAPIIHPDAVGSPDRLHRRLLELNLSALYQCAFALDAQGDVVVTSDRICRAIDREEVKSLIDVLALFADEYDDALIRDFGGHRWGE